MQSMPTDGPRPWCRNGTPRNCRATAIRSAATLDRPRNGAGTGVGSRNVGESAEVAVAVVAPVEQAPLRRVAPELGAVRTNAERVADLDRVAHRQHQGERASGVLLDIHFDAGVVASEPFHDAGNERIVAGA